MRGVYRFNIVWNVTIDRISVSAEIAPKNIRLADKIYIFGWNSSEPQKFWRQRGATKFRRGGAGVYVIIGL